MEAAVTVGLKEIAKSGVSVFVAYGTHYGATKIYTWFCVPDGISGFIQGLVTTASPWCRITLETMKVTENQYSTLILIGVSRLVMASLGI